VAESVETARQVKILRELGADVGQGYFFAKPLAVEDALMLTTMDPLPVFPLTNLGDDVDDDDDVDDVDDVRDAGAEVDNRYGGDGPDRFEDSTDAMAGGEAGIAAEVIGALDAVSEAGAGSGGGADEFTLTEDMHVEAADLSLVSKKGRLLASFRKGKPA